jgi:hypothetical protein
MVSSFVLPTRMASELSLAMWQSLSLTGRSFPLKPLARFVLPLRGAIRLLSRAASRSGNLQTRRIVGSSHHQGSV